MAERPATRLALTAQAFALTFIFPELSIRLLIDGAAVDLTGPSSRYRNIPCLVTTDDCSPDGIQVDVEPGTLRSLVTARAVQGQALGFPIVLTPADQAVLAEFATRIGLSAAGTPSK